MKKTALVVIDLQNDITKNYKNIMGQVNKAISWATANEMHRVPLQGCERIQGTVHERASGSKGK